MKLAVIQTGGKQYKVKKGDVLRVEKLPGEKDKEITFDKVLLISDKAGKEFQLGDPYVKGAKVKAKVMEQGRARKITGIKYKPKVRHRIKYGHRQMFTQVKILEI